jgi:hypothetical protein
MNRPILLTACAIVLMGVISLVNCADPMEDGNPRQFTPVGPGGDTIYTFDTMLVFDTTVIYDSTFNFDTVVVIDTIVNIDTLVVIDTTSDVDTIFIDPSGPGGFGVVCARLSSAQKEIVWMFRNAEGTYLLEFVASVERAHPNQTLSVDIDGQTFLWNPLENSEYITEQLLGQHAVIRITPNKPMSLGHAIDICLTVSAP